MRSRLYSVTFLSFLYGSIIDLFLISQACSSMSISSRLTVRLSSSGGGRSLGLLFCSLSAGTWQSYLLHWTQCPLLAPLQWTSKWAHLLLLPSILTQHPSLGVCVCKTSSALAAVHSLSAASCAALYYIVNSLGRLQYLPWAGKLSVSILLSTLCTDWHYYPSVLCPEGICTQLRNPWAMVYIDLGPASFSCTLNCQFCKYYAYCTHHVLSWHTSQVDMHYWSIIEGPEGCVFTDPLSVTTSNKWV